MSSIVDDALNQKMKEDPEPQRYYDWMLWKMRQEEKARPKNTFSKEEIYKKELAEMQKTIDDLQVRVKKLNDAIIQLQKQNHG